MMIFIMVMMETVRKGEIKKRGIEMREKWSNRGRKDEVEKRIIADINVAMEMPFYDQDKNRSLNYNYLLAKAILLYSKDDEEIEHAKRAIEIYETYFDGTASPLECDD